MTASASVAAKSKANGRTRATKPDHETAETAELLAALRAFRRGDFSVRLPRDLTGIDGEIAEAFNDVVELNDRMTKEFERLGETVGRQGKINQRAKLPAAHGLLGRQRRRGQHPDRRHGAPDRRNGPRDRRRGQGRPLPDHGPGERGAARCAASSCASARW